jgi:hypothetical protein
MLAIFLSFGMQPFLDIVDLTYRNNLIRQKYPTMKKLIFILLLLTAILVINAQTAMNLFRQDVPVTWLGIDYSHVKIIGNFAEFFDAGEKSTWQIRDIYFPGWNAIILEEPAKYDIRGMLRKGDIVFDLDMVSAINAQTPLETMEAYKTIRFTEEDIQSFVKSYDLKGREGIGIVFIAECLNKNALEALYHFVAIDMPSGKVLLHERLRGQPSGFGLRNYWANSIHKVIRNIRDYYYWEWNKRAFSNKTI